MDRITDAFVWPVRDREWAGKIVIIGLILLVPIVGAVNGLGWMLVTIDRLRAGEQNLPPASFRFLGRGFELFVVNLVYVAAIALILVALFVPTLALSSAQGGGSSSTALVALAVLLNVVVFSLATLASLALYFAMPAIILGTDRGGIAGGLNVAAVYRQMRISPINTLIAGLMLIAVGFVSQLGVAVCIVGVLFTSAYGLAMQAWIVRSYELGAAEPQPRA